MRIISFILAAAAVVGCASSTTTPSLRQICQDGYSEVWSAARFAVAGMGGTAVNAVESKGVILARIEEGDPGSEVELHITLSRLPDHQPGTLEPITVSVRATGPGASEPTEGRREELRELEEQFLARVSHRAQCRAPTEAR